MYRFKSEDIVLGTPGYQPPLSITYSPNGKLVTYLFPDETGYRKVYAIDLERYQEGAFKLFNMSNINIGSLSIQEQLRRERMRLFTQGISSYEWNSNDNDSQKNDPNMKQRMIIPLNGQIYLYDERIEDPSLRYILIYDNEYGNAVDPHLSPNGESVAFVVNDDLYVIHINDLIKAANETKSYDDTSNSNISSQVPPIIRLTSNGKKAGITCGLADFIAQEEMDRYRGFWWSPCSTMIVYAEANETVVPEYNILHLGKDDPTHSEMHRYPFAGKVNPEVKLYVLKVPPPTPTVAAVGSKVIGLEEVDHSKHVELDILTCARSHSSFTTISSLATSNEDPCITNMNIDYYIGRVDWWQDGSVMVQLQNRAQTVLQLLKIDPNTGLSTLVLEESSKYWINLHDILYLFPTNYEPPQDTHMISGDKTNDFYFIWASERSGFRQLYLYKYDSTSSKGQCLSDKPIGGGGNFVVESIEAIDVVNGGIYFSGNKSHPTERHLYYSSFLPKNPYSNETFEITSFQRGTHDSKLYILGDICYVVDCYSSITSPFTMCLYTLEKQTLKLSLLSKITDSLEICPRMQIPNYLQSITIPSLHKIQSDDGKVDLYCAVYLPPMVTFNADATTQEYAPCSAIMSVYGGPHVQRVSNNWPLTADLRAQCLAQEGFVVIKCDNRGSYRRGIEFEGALHLDMGNIEIQDQVTVVKYFVSKGLIDPSRVGMFGWSYGGYMSAMSICRAPDVFTCAVAGAPVTSWDGYDTHYTERYMGTPKSNPQGYNNSSVMNHLASMKGKLMLVHGLIDENVHFRHTARLINGLIQHRKRYELMLFPDERHSPHKMQDKIYIEDIMHEFFLKNLIPTIISTSKLLVITNNHSSNSNVTNNSNSSTYENRNIQNTDPIIITRSSL